jgi:hypothetical protein
MRNLRTRNLRTRNLRTSTILMWLGYPVLIAAFFVGPEIATPLAVWGFAVGAIAALCNFLGD